MHQTSGIIIPAPDACLLESGSVAGLVAQRPDDHRRAVFIPDDAALYPVQNQRLELLPLSDQSKGGLVAAAEQLRYAMALDVRFVDHVKAVAVAHLHEPGRVGVMAAADGVHVMLLHQSQIPEGLLVADGEAGHRVGIVPVHTLQAQRLAVQQHLAALCGDVPHAHRLADDLLFGAQQQLIQLRRFGRPEARLLQMDGELGGRFAPADKTALRIIQLPLQRPFAAVPFHAHLDHRTGVILPAPGTHAEVPDMLPGPYQQVHIPKDTGHTELVLAFQIGAQAPFHHQHRQQVFTLHQIGGHIKLTGGVAHLAVTHPVAVHPYIKEAVHAFKVQVDLLAEHGRIHREMGTISPAGILMGHKGRVKRNGIAHIAVLVLVQALGLPAGRHRHLRITAGIKIRLAELLRHSADLVIQLHLPGAVQQNETLRGFSHRLHRVLIRSKGNIVRPIGHNAFVRACPVFKFMAVFHRIPPFLFNAAVPAQGAGAESAPAFLLLYIYMYIWIIGTADRSACRRRSPRPRCPWCQRRPRNGAGRPSPPAGCAAPRECAAWRLG